MDSALATLVPIDVFIYVRQRSIQPRTASPIALNKRMRKRTIVNSEYPISVGCNACYRHEGGQNFLRAIHSARISLEFSVVRS